MSKLTHIETLGELVDALNATNRLEAEELAKLDEDQEVDETPTKYDEPTYSGPLEQTPDDGVAMPKTNAIVLSCKDIILNTLKADSVTREQTDTMLALIELAHKVKEL